MITEADSRLVAGVMSGTSLDGVDVCLARLTGHGRALQVETLQLSSTSFQPDVRALLLETADSQTVDLDEFSQLNVRLAHVYAEAIRACVHEAGLTLTDLDLVGSHGQTVRHVPDAKECAGLQVTSTLQIGDPSVLAQLIGVPVVGDFRLADMALGGQGAPLVPYLDYVLLSHPSENRGCLNLGGIANLTILPAGQKAEEVYGFDTGPANIIIDQLSQTLLNHPYDENGQLAALGHVDQELLLQLLCDEYLHRKPPKSTGREYYGSDYIAKLNRLAGILSPHDLLATATAFTADSIFAAYNDFVAHRHSLDRLIVAGGGVHNATLMRRLRDSFAPIPVQESRLHGIDEDGKEALCFAVLAHETASGYSTNMPLVTGASRAAILGKYCPA